MSHSMIQVARMCTSSVQRTTSSYSLGCTRKSLAHSYMSSLQDGDTPCKVAVVTGSQHQSWLRAFLALLSDLRLFPHGKFVFHEHVMYLCSAAIRGATHIHSWSIWLPEITHGVQNLWVVLPTTPSWCGIKQGP
jgi:hypothetical protein